MSNIIENFEYGFSLNSKMTPYEETIKSKALFIPYRSLILRIIQFITQNFSGMINDDMSNVLILVSVIPNVARLAAILFPDIHFLSFGYKDDDEEETEKIVNLTIPKVNFSIKTVNSIKKNNPDSTFFMFIEHESKNTLKDLNLHKKWVNEIKPFAYTIKLKLPYPARFKSTEQWMKGKYFWRAWGGINSSITYFESSLKHSTCLWDLKQYEELCSYHNYARSIDKYQYFTSEDSEIHNSKFVMENVGLTDDYDSTLEIIILKNYANGDLTKVLALSNLISSKLGRLNNLKTIRNK